MSAAEIIGSIGVALLLLAFFLQQVGVLSGASRLYLLLNLVGAGLACLASVVLPFVPFVILEGTWALVSGFYLFRGSPHARAKRRVSAARADLE